MWDSEKEEELKMLRKEKHKRTQFWGNLIEDLLFWFVIIMTTIGAYHSLVFVKSLFT